MKPFELPERMSVARPDARLALQIAMPVVLVLGWIATMVAGGSADVLRWLVAGAGGLALVTGAALILWVLPGMAVIAWLWHDHRLTIAEHIGVAWGIGAALPPLLLSLAHVAGLPWNGWTTLSYVFLMAAAWVAAFWRRNRQTPTATAERQMLAMPAPAWAAVLCVALLALALVARLYTTRDMLVGANVDNYHHTLIVQLLVDHGGLFQSWEPYAPLTTLTYHYGFHANAAFFHWLTGTPVPRAVLDAGQAMNAATVIAVCALTARLTGSVIAGVWAALIVGFFNTIPAFLTFWGRNPFVASHVILVAVLLAWMAAIEAPQRSWRLLALAALLSAGLALSHYQTTMIAGLMLLVSMTMLRLRSTPATILATLGRAAIIGAGALILTLPWLLNITSGYLDRNMAHATRPEAAAGQILAAAVPALAPLYLKGPVIALALAGLLLAARRRDWRAALPAAWALTALAAAMPHLLGLPGTGVIQGDVSAMMLYLAAAPLAGITLAELHHLAERSAPRLAVPLSTAIIVIVSAWGIGWQRDLVPAYMRMVTPPDLRAMAWVREHTPPNARFVVNSHPIYGGDMIAGTDAGWWLPLFTGRQTNVPPMTYGSEMSADPQYAAHIHALARDLRRRELVDGRMVLVDLARPEAIAALRAADIGYVFSGAQPLAGPGAIPAPDRIDTAKLRASPDFRLVYAEDGVEIFELVSR